MAQKSLISRITMLAVCGVLTLSTASCSLFKTESAEKTNTAPIEQAAPPRAAQANDDAATFAQITPAAGDERTAGMKLASAPEPDAPQAPAYSNGINDPLEPLNRAVFGFNDLLDVYLIEPAAEAYLAVFPDFARDGIQNFMRNLRAPLILANDLLQGKIGDAGVTTARFVINTTAGVGGLFDVASTQGLYYKSEDFGQTLGAWGFGEGFYLVLPLYGPSNLRDTVGLGVDGYADPVRIWTFKTGRDWIYYTRNGVEGFDNRARIVTAVQDLRRSSLDYYAAVRSAYTQKRRADVRSGSTSHSIPDYDENP